jgi:hypothetical protein
VVQQLYAQLLVAVALMMSVTRHQVASHFHFVQHLEVPVLVLCGATLSVVVGVDQ